MTDQCEKVPFEKLFEKLRQITIENLTVAFLALLLYPAALTQSVCKCQGSVSYSHSLGSTKTILIKCEWTDQKLTLTSRQLALRWELHLTDKTQVGSWVLWTAPLLSQCKAGARAAGWLDRACVCFGMGRDAWVWYTVSVHISQLWSFDFLLQ